MKRIVFLLMVVLLTGILVTATAEYNVASAANEKLFVLNWDEYIDISLIDEFEEYYKNKTGKNIDVTYSTRDTNENMLTQTIESDKSAGNGTMQLDMLCPSEYSIQKLIEKGLLQKIGNENAWDHIDGMIAEHVDGAFADFTVNGEKIDIKDYFVPYMWGTLGILYNKDVVKEEDLNKGWGLLWNANNNPELTGKIYMKDSIRDVWVAAILYLKEINKLPSQYNDYSVEKLINTVSPDLLNAVEEVLKEQKQEKVLYSVDFDKDAVIAGTAYIDLAWSGDAIYAIEEAKTNHNRNLGYFIPETGSNIWFDGWVIPRKAQNPEAAKMFIEFLNMPENAIRNMLEIGYTSGVAREAMRTEEVNNILIENEIDPEELFNDENQYFSGTMPMGVMRDFGENEAKVISMWERVKSSGIDIGSIILIVVAIIAVIAVVVVLFVLKSKKGKRVKV